jgi:hypothetical protein
MTFCHVWQFGMVPNSIGVMYVNHVLRIGTERVGVDLIKLLKRLCPQMEVS